MKRSSDDDILLKAIDFAAEKHMDQRRKGLKQIPYINHPLRVARTLQIHGEKDGNLLSAAVLHDTIEDTSTTIDDIRREFGIKVARLVKEVSDDMALPAMKRKQLQISGAAKLSDNAKKIKIADKICNISDLIKYPITWSERRKYEYIIWSVDVIKYCRGVNEFLEAEFDKVAEEGIDWFRP